MKSKKCTSIDNKIIRTTNDKIKNFLNTEIKKTPVIWTYGEEKQNFGEDFQRLIGKYFKENLNYNEYSEVLVSTSPNSQKKDITLIPIDKTIATKEYHVKSFADYNLEDITICNSPELLDDKPTILINYTIDLESNLVKVINVIETELHRLVAVKTSGYYEGCLSSTRDTGKKIKAKKYADFMYNKTDKSLEELKKLGRKTVLFYSASKLVDKKYNFTNEEILEAIEILRKRKKVY